MMLPACAAWLIHGELNCKSKREKVSGDLLDERRAELLSLGDIQLEGPMFGAVT